MQRFWSRQDGAEAKFGAGSTEHGEIGRSRFSPTGAKETHLGLRV